jgi:hypothetical protein
VLKLGEMGLLQTPSRRFGFGSADEIMDVLETHHADRVERIVAVEASDMRRCIARPTGGSSPGAI